jgi:hypothetical protein
MQEKMTPIIYTTFVGTCCLGDLFVIASKIKENPEAFEVEPLPYIVDVFYLDSFPKRIVVQLNVN